MDLLKERADTVRRWAILTGAGFIGPFWLSHGQQPGPHMLPVALFLTRERARRSLPLVKGPKDRGRFPDARVVRVSVTVRVEE